MTDILHRIPIQRGSGVSRVATIAPPPDDRVPMASTQGTLALEYDRGPTPHHRPELRSVERLREELDAFASRFSAAVVEVLGGDRGPQQLRRWTSEEVYADLARRVNELAATVGSDQRLRRLRAQVRSVHLFCPSIGVAELSVHVRHGHRSRALAARLEHVADRWVCTALELG